VLKLFRIFFSTVLVAALAACGGGGGSSGATGVPGGTGSGTGTTSQYKVTVSTYDVTGAATNVLSGASTLTVKAVVTDKSGVPQANVVVTFTLDSAIASLSPISGTALTDSTGTAQSSLKSNGTSGAGTITASASVQGVAYVGTATYSINTVSAAPAAINFVSAVPSDSSIVIKGAGGNGRTEAALLTFQVVDSTNTGIANVKVDFALSGSSNVTLGATSGITDTSGKTTITVNSGSSPTVVRVIATVDGTAIAALSDTVTVTTGQPVQTAMSLAHQFDDIEGWDFDGMTNTITVSMADQFGGVVADGTQAVFTTNSGAIIGDADTGGKPTARCLTKNGACTVTWRSQNPRASVVTVVATAANSTGSLSASTSFINSGSNVVFTGPSAADFSANCSPQQLTVVASDENGYVLPAGSSITIENLPNGTITFYPLTIPGPSSTSAGGTSITLTITPPSTCAVGGTSTTKIINPVLVVTTPKLKRGTLNLTVKYPSP
jgi:hypothetical protein